MTDLKTLEDLENENWKEMYKGTKKWVREKLRQEAIKWIKELKELRRSDKKDRNFSNAMLCTNCGEIYKERIPRNCENCNTNNYYALTYDSGYGPDNFEGAIKILKHFFNISEEDIE